MTYGSHKKRTQGQDPESVAHLSSLECSVEEANAHLKNLKPPERLCWAYNQFKSNFALTTSFGIQSAVLLHMLHELNEGENIPVIWVDTGYLPPETYAYAEELTKTLNINVQVSQSSISPARMEALYGKLWSTDRIEDIEKYHQIRKIQPLENSLSDLGISCWASGVRGKQTDHRKSMNWIDPIRGRLALRPILEWTTKDIYYYMNDNKLPQHPLFEKGYSTVGDWHSSGPDNNDVQGRDTRFGGLKQECGIHLPGPGIMGDGI